MGLRKHDHIVNYIQLTEIEYETVDELLKTEIIEFLIFLLYLGQGPKFSLPLFGVCITLHFFLFSFHFQNEKKTYT